MRAEAAKYLLDALNACRAICQFTAGMTTDAYREDLLVRSAVERQFEILGEAFSRLDKLAPSYRRSSPALGDIIGMRNRIIHGYDSVDAAIVWDAVQNRVPQLRAWLETLSLEPGAV